MSKFKVVNNRKIKKKKSSVKSIDDVKINQVERKKMEDNSHNNFLAVRYKIDQCYKNGYILDVGYNKLEPSSISYLIQKVDQLRYINCINLAGIFKDENPTDINFKRLFYCLEKVNINTLILDGNLIFDINFIALYDLLNNNNKIKKLSLKSCVFNADEIVKLNFKSLNNVDIRGIMLEKSKNINPILLFIRDLLGNLKTLKISHLEFNKIILPKSGNLVKLYLSYCGIKDKNVNMLCDLININKSLACLKINNNSIKDMKKIFLFLNSSSTNLKYLDISNNKTNNNDFLSDINYMKKSGLINLKKLDMYGMDINLPIPVTLTNIGVSNMTESLQDALKKNKEILKVIEVLYLFAKYNKNIFPKVLIDNVLFPYLYWSWFN